MRIIFCLLLSLALFFQAPATARYPPLGRTVQRRNTNIKDENMKLNQWKRKKMLIIEIQRIKNLNQRASRECSCPEIINEKRAQRLEDEWLARESVKTS